MILYECPGCLQVRYEEEKDYIVFEWRDFGISFEDIEQAHTIALRTAVERSCSRYLADCFRARDVLAPEIIVWWRETWLPKLIASGVRVIVTIEPSSTYAAASNRNWQRDPGSGLSILSISDPRKVEAAFASFADRLDRPRTGRP